MNKKKNDKIKDRDITVESKTNGLSLSAVVGTQLVRKLYIGSSQKEAKAHFLAEVNSAIELAAIKVRKTRI